MSGFTNEEITRMILARKVKEKEHRMDTEVYKLRKELKQTKEQTSAYIAELEKYISGGYENKNEIKPEWMQRLLDDGSKHNEGEGPGFIQRLLNI